MVCYDRSTKKQYILLPKDVLHVMVPFLPVLYIFSNELNFHQRGSRSLGPVSYLTSKYLEICNDCLCSLVEMKVDYKVRDQGLKIRNKSWVSLFQVLVKKTVNMLP